MPIVSSFGWEPSVMVPGIVVIGLLVLYCWYDLARGSTPQYLPAWAWAVAVVALGPIGSICYLVFEKLQLMQVPSTAPEELTTKQGGNLYFRGH